MGIERLHLKSKTGHNTPSKLLLPHRYQLFLNIKIYKTCKHSPSKCHPELQVAKFAGYLLLDNYLLID